MLSSVFWLVDILTSAWLWLPPGVSWADMKNPAYGHFNDLFICIPLTMALIILRFFFEIYVFPHVGEYLGISKQKITNIEPNPILEKFYLQNRKISVKRSKLADLSKQTGMSVRAVQAWIRSRRSKDVIPPMRKFVESLWKGCFYGFTFTYGLSFLIYSPWFWNLDYLWIDLPFHPVDIWSYGYYLLQLSYYLGCLLTLCWDIKRKDFQQLLIHHIATLVLIIFSYSVSFWRVGTLIMLAHDVGDVVLELSKAIKYAGYDRITPYLFGLFGVTFFVSRLVYYPIIIYSCICDSVRFLAPQWTVYEYLSTPSFWVPTHIFFLTFLTILLCLHVFWFSIILKMLLMFIRDNHNEITDVRSETEPDSVDDLGDEAVVKDSRRAKSSVGKRKIN